MAKRQKKQLKLDQVGIVDNRKPTAAAPISQQSADKLILRFIVDSLSPVSHVEHPSFLALVHGLAPHVNVCSRWTLSRRILDENKEMKSNIQEVFKSTSTICLTADAWSGFRNRRSFLGVTGHVLSDDLRRQSFALACRLFTGSHTYDRIAALLCKVMKEYAITVDKVICCVTDNGSNFVKAFREFQVELNDHGGTDDDEDESDNDNLIDQVQTDLHELLNSNNFLHQTDTNADVSHELDAENSPERENEDDQNSSGISDEETDDNPMTLPPHQRCASHTLNLVGSNAPTVTAKANAKYRSLLHSSNGKLSAIWNKVNKQISNEIMSDILGCQLLTPVPTRWNSYYDARRSLLFHSSDKLEAVCKALDLPCFKEQELAFLKEENRVLTPLAESLDRLQGQTNPESYMGFLFPTLFQLRHQYGILMADTSLKFCSPLATNILVDINNRFKVSSSF